MEEEESTRKAKKGWYPGKYASGGHAEKVDKTEKAEEDESQKSKSGWYPGKFAAKAIRRTSTTSTPSTIGPSSSPNSSENRRQSVTNDRVSTPGDSSDRRGSELLRESIDLYQRRFLKHLLLAESCTIEELLQSSEKSAESGNFDITLEFLHSISKIYQAIYTPSELTQDLFASIQIIRDFRIKRSRNAFC
jgi:hypothetical protein